MKTIIEPFRVKVVEPIRMTTADEREAILRRASFNLFQVRAEDVIIDLLTDSGTSAMSAAQWGAMMRGDESYAGARSFFRFEEAVKDLTGYENIIPTHQGRAAERILFASTATAGDVIPNNSHFDTTRANVEAGGAVALDLPCSEAAALQSKYPFKGNIDLERLQQTIDRQGRQKIPLVMITVTNNTGGGQPVSLENLRRTSEICRANGIPLYLDAARFAENAYLIKLKEPGQSERSVREIAQEMFQLADGCTMSAKKDALVNIGGFVATNDSNVAERMRNNLILTEGFPTYGGMAGRDLEAIACGLGEILDEDYLAYRLASTRYVGRHVSQLGVPIMLPVGGHAIYLDARQFLPHVPTEQFPGQALAVELYREGGVRSVEIGGVMFGKAAQHDLVRLAIPRRVYTQSHMDYVVEVVEQVYRRREEISGMRITWEPPTLRHFTARFDWV
ncbi:MAG: tryptophanase [Deltaproteobacteria bacterium]|nr:tryptophanase [Deltaproteobacteria bacterium]